MKQSFNRDLATTSASVATFSAANVRRARLRHPGLPIHKVVIVRSTDRDQLRDQITGRKAIRTGAYPSRKMQRGRFGEAAAELARIIQEEVDVGVVDAIAQPCRGEVLLDDGWHVHLPDFANLRSDGRRVLIDAKRDWSDFRTANGRRQTFLGQIIAEAMGYDYEHYVLAHAGTARRRENVDTVQAARFVSVPDHLVALAAATVGKGPIALRNLAAILHPVYGRSMAYALMVRRVVEIDLDGKLGDHSECRAVPPLPVAMPSIRQ
ncbi:hypothetical protein [Sphingomonas sp. AX6]|uniref:hypothetical protein n=1 Tax=Sphingomonas sp. AX6 TaxID=2653171 RepID=UPI0012F2366D|nr:hypothetical protein [Sphingomonas sp. AX6]VXC84621.1 conserved hypothetical protein [Sphingomonas sp. AX6]